MPASIRIIVPNAIPVAVYICSDQFGRLKLVIMYINNKIKPNMLNDKIVLVGVAAAGLHDLWPTPFGPGYPGVEKHATVVANILDERFILRPELSGVAEILFMLLSALALGIMAGGRRSLMLWISCTLLFGLAVAGSYWGFTAHNLWFQPLFPALLINHSILEGAELEKFHSNLTDL